MDEQSFKSLTSHKGQKVRTITIEEKLKIVSEAKIAGNRPTIVALEIFQKVVFGIGEKR